MLGGVDACSLFASSRRVQACDKAPISVVFGCCRPLKGLSAVILSDPLVVTPGSAFSRETWDPYLLSCPGLVAAGSVHYLDQ